MCKIWTFLLEWYFLCCNGSCKARNVGEQLVRSEIFPGGPYSNYNIDIDDNLLWWFLVHLTMGFHNIYHLHPKLAAPSFYMGQIFCFIIWWSGYLFTPQGKTGEVQFEYVPSAKFELFWLSDISYVAKGPVKPPKLANNARSPCVAEVALTPIII